MTHDSVPHRSPMARMCREGDERVRSTVTSSCLSGRRPQQLVAASDGGSPPLPGAMALSLGQCAAQGSTVIPSLEPGGSTYS